jgi:transcriptional regulator EpsA
MMETAAETRSSMYTRMDMDILLLNVEIAIRIARRTEFFSWIQGVFQGAIAHEALVCGLAYPGQSGLRFEWQGSFPMPPDRFAELCSTDRGVIYKAVRCWHENPNVPLLVDPSSPESAMGETAELADLVRRWELKNLIAHGVPGLDGRPACFFALCKLQKAPSAHDAQVISMLLPYLYSAWLRANCDPRADNSRVATAPMLTQREIEILDWMQKGKSNGEIASILGISQLTVKNHVQKILRKMGAHNRTQAVAKGISLSITRGGKMY